MDWEAVALIAVVVVLVALRWGTRIWLRRRRDREAVAHGEPTEGGWLRRNPWAYVLVGAVALAFGFLRVG